MPKNVIAELPESLQSIKTRHLFTLQLDVKPMIIVGATPNGFKRNSVISAGTFDGDRLSGIVLEGGADWQLLRPDNSVILDVRMNLQTNDGALISMTYKGIRTGEADILKRIDSGADVDPSTYYFRTTATFETASANYTWLNNIIAVGTGYRIAKGVIYSLFEVL